MLIEFKSYRDYREFLFL